MGRVEVKLKILGNNHHTRSSGDSEQSRRMRHGKSLEEEAKTTKERERDITSIQRFDAAFSGRMLRSRSGQLGSHGPCSHGGAAPGRRSPSARRNRQLPTRQQKLARKDNSEGRNSGRAGVPPDIRPGSGDTAPKEGEGHVVRPCSRRLESVCEGQVDVTRVTSSDPPRQQQRRTGHARSPPPLLRRRRRRRRPRRPGPGRTRATPRRRPMRCGGGAARARSPAPCPSSPAARTPPAPSRPPAPPPPLGSRPARGAGRVSPAGPLPRSRARSAAGPGP